MRCSVKLKNVKFIKLRLYHKASYNLSRADSVEKPENCCSYKMFLAIAEFLRHYVLSRVLPRDHSEVMKILNISVFQVRVEPKIL